MTTKKVLFLLLIMALVSCTDHDARMEEALVTAETNLNNYDAAIASLSEKGIDVGPVRAIRSAIGKLTVELRKEFETSREKADDDNKKYWNVHKELITKVKQFSEVQKPFTLPSQSVERGELRIAFHAETKRVRFLGAAEGATISQPGSLPANATPEAAARNFLKTYGLFFGLKNSATELQFMKDRVLPNGRSMARFQQVFASVPIFAGEVIVNMDANKNILSVMAETIPDIRELRATGNPVDPNEIELTEADAAAIALAKTAFKKKVDVSELSINTGKLHFFNHALLGDPGPRFTRLVWRFEVTSQQTQHINELLLVDANTGVVALSVNQIAAAMDRKTYDMMGQTDLGLAQLLCEETTTCDYANGFDRHIVTTHKFAASMYDFYFTEHGRDGIEDDGMPMESYMHYIGKTVSWDPTLKAFIHPSTVTIHNFPVPEDVVGHEFTHGVTQAESGLFYYYQSGAINESFSDVWGEFIDQTHTDSVMYSYVDQNGDPQVDPDDTDTSEFDWAFAEDLIKLTPTSPGGGNAFPLRDLKNPSPPDPDRMTSEYYHCATTDNGGVHHNSGVNNKAAYLMTEGDTFNGITINGLGDEKVWDIYYETQINLLSSGSDYADLCTALPQACINLGLSASDCAEVQKVVDAVEMCIEPTMCDTPSVDVCSASDFPSNLFFDDLENTALASVNWTSGNLNGVDAWNRYATQYSNSGTRHIYSPNQAVVSDTFIQTRSIVLPANLINAYLHFHHAYGFDDDGNGTYDGGVIEYSTDFGNSWNDAGTLMPENGYTGTINSASNPLNTRPAFVGDSKGYISSRIDLSSLINEGENVVVQFRFRIGTDAQNKDEGWFIDDVRINSCVNTTNACGGIETIQSVTTGNWSDNTTWSTLTTPNINDVVKINSNDVVSVTTDSNQLGVMSLCNSGTLRGANNHGFDLVAGDFILNSGSFVGSNGFNGASIASDPWRNAFDGGGVKLTADKIINEGTIRAGNGGDEETHIFFTGEQMAAFGGDGGDIELNARIIINENVIGAVPANNFPPPGFEIGKGGLADNFGDVNAQNDGDAIGGAGGDITLTATGYIQNTGHICGGDGGDAISGGSGMPDKGKGGIVTITAPIAFIAGEVCTGQDGGAIVDPSISLLDSASIKGAKDLILYGGDDWELNINNLKSGAISATDSITLATGARGTVDLRGNTNKVLKAKQVAIHSDNILLDEGATLSTVIDAADIKTGPAQILYSMVLQAPRLLSVRESGSETSVKLSITNTGPAEDIYLLSVKAPERWSVTAPTFVLVDAISREEISLNVKTARLAEKREDKMITLTATSLSDPQVQSTTKIQLTK